jgi:sigma-B regulation protein RsbU (phosphoserine phosphatase)
MLGASGVPLGILPVTQFESEQITLGVGDVLVAATDGFNEAFSPSGEMFGYDRLLATVQELAPMSAEEIGHGLYAAVEAYGQGHPQDDDQTVVVLKGVPA